MKRNQLPKPLAVLMTIDLDNETLVVIEGPTEAASHNSSLLLLSGSELMIMPCNPHLYVYSKTNSYVVNECDLRGDFGGCTLDMSMTDKTLLTCNTLAC